MNASVPFTAPLAPLGQRRRVVLLTFGGYALVLLVLALQSLFKLGDWILLLPIPLGMVATFIGGIQLMKPSRLGLPEGRDRTMDERQWQRLSQAHTVAYRILGMIFLLSTGYFYAAHGQNLPLPTSSFAWSTIWLGAAIFIPVLPTAILAWTEPDPAEGDA